jgi:formylmethanofuran dehydrogenase subunit B
VDGKPTAFDEAVQHAVEILRGSKSPLVWGLARGSTAGHRAAVALAEQIGGTVDTVTSTKPEAAMAFQKLGQSTCTLGEVRNRADLVVFWRANPVVTHPRHLERYSVEPPGLFVPRGKADRTIVVVDVASTETSERADTFLKIASVDETVVVESLKRLVRGEEASETTLSSELLSQLKRLAQQLKDCKYGALFLGGANSQARGDATEALFMLTRELNAFTRFTVHVLGRPTGAENVLTWQTGFPFAVNFALGYPRFDPQAFSANVLLERGEVDSCVLVGSDSVQLLSPAATDRLQQLPTIALDYPYADPGFAATVRFTTAIYGIHAAGTAYRMDGVSIPLRKILSAEYPTDEEVLNGIASQLKA